MRDAMLPRGELDRDAPGPKDRYRKGQSSSLGNNIKSAICDIDINRMDDRRQTLEDLKRITSLKIKDPLLEQFEIERNLAVKRKRERFESLLQDIDDEFERLIKELEGTS